MAVVLYKRRDQDSRSTIFDGVVEGRNLETKEDTNQSFHVALLLRNQELYHQALPWVVGLLLGVYLR
jgi:hypothetical protein